MKNSNINVLIIGFGGHGKTTVAEILCEKLNWTQGESLYLVEMFIFDEMVKRGFNYSSPYECWLERSKHRLLFQEIILNFNTPDKTKTTKMIFENNEIFTGMRNVTEFSSGYFSGLFSVIIYVDAQERLGIEEPNDCTIPKNISHLIIENNDSKEDFLIKIENLVHVLNLFTKSNESNFEKFYNKLLEDSFVFEGLKVPDCNEKHEAIKSVYQLLT
jgi:hypothetical protein